MTTMNFSANEVERATGLFLDTIGELIAERRREIPTLWASACKDTWTISLRDFKSGHPIVCNHQDESLDGLPISSSSSSEEGSGASSNISSERLSQPRSHFPNIISRYTSGLSHSFSQSKEKSSSRRVAAFRPSQRSSELFQIPDDPSSSSANTSSKTIKNVSTGQSAPDHTIASSQPGSHCKKCTGDDPTTFPFVSDVAPLAILMVLEAVQNHNELSFSPMTPAYIPDRPEYLSNGMSFRVTRVPWQQVRADTEGRIVSDAVYKRLNRNAPRKAWLDFMKDLVVTHHMTYHVSDSHKRNVVKLLGLGWERIIDDFVGEPTLAPVIALEYASYGTLQDLFYSSSFLSSYQQKLRLLSDIAEGLQALHFSNVTHGDVKPNNILVCKDQTHGILAKLSDFGLSIIDPEAGAEFQRLPGGTEEYLAPEAHRLIARDQLKYTDVYSFGVVVWQTLLGGTVPFFSPRYLDGQFLSKAEIQRLKTGKHAEMADAYGIRVDEQQFSRLNRGDELQQQSYQPPEDPVNALLVAMARDSLAEMSGIAINNAEPFGSSSEFGIFLSVLQISLSSCPIHRRLESVLILLGKPYERRQISISKIMWKAKVEMALQKNLRYQTVTARSKELYSTIFEQFFVTLQRNPNCHDLNKLSHWDAVLARHLSSSLVEYYIWKFLGGDHSETTRDSLLTYLALCSSAGDLDMCSAGLSIHQLLGVNMRWVNLYTTGTALAMIKGDNNLWNIRHPASVKFQAQLTKGLIKRFQEEQIDGEQNRIAAHVLMELEIGPFDVNYQNNQGDTLLNLACQSGNFPLVFQLITDHGASASISNNYGEEPIHWLHQIPSEDSHIVEAITVLLAQAGADIEAFAQPRVADYSLSFSNNYLFPTPLLRAVARQNLSAVSCLVQIGADISVSQSAIYAQINMSPLSLACAMLEYECLGVMLADWKPGSDPMDPDNVEVRGLWEEAIGGLSGRDRIKIHGDQYALNVSRTLAVLTAYLGPGWLVRKTQSSLLYAVEGGDLVWVEALLNSLFSDPMKAVLADLQKGLECAVAQGYKHIVAKLMEYGALPLLPHRWSMNNYTAGRPGKWSEGLIDKMTDEMYESGHVCANTKCSLHLCATGGVDGVAIAESILRYPIVNECLKPALPDANDHGLSHFVIATIDGKYPRLNRPDENHYTPLYEAMAHGEFALAQCYLDQGASLPHQIEYLLKRSPRKPPFNLTRRVFGRVQPQANWGLHPAAELKNWSLEEGTIITATADACRAFDEFNKERCWRAVLSVFNSPSELLAKAEDGRDALEIAIDAVDRVTLDMLVKYLQKHPNVFVNYSVVDRIRDRLLADPPSHVADSVVKERVVSYRRDLGDMVNTMLSAGDNGIPINTRSDISERILEHVTNEFTILLVGFTQRGNGNISKDKFKSDMERFINAFMMALYSCQQSSHEWNNVLEGLKKGLTKLLSPYFGISFCRQEYLGRRAAKVELTSKKKSISPHNLHSVGWNSRQSEITIGAGNSELKNLRGIEPLLDWPLYRKTVVAELRIASPTNSLPLPNFANVPLQYLTLQNLGFVMGTRISIPGADYFTATMLRASCPNRTTRICERENRPDRAYYFKSLQTKGERLSKTNMKTQENKLKYFENVIQRINPFADNVALKEMARLMRDLVCAHAENLVDTRELTKIDPEDMHPLFGKARVERMGENATYMDLPMDAYIESGQKLQQELLKEYERCGRDLPDELKRILNLEYEQSDDNE
ncbi:hypothetical protein AOQ84DRAFT_225375 [Glonium stellatum]|uniref:Protein kinase domain-containing protein n=1 Tax=Glonium stellatum TaxID=574774 RepID=A0A8E2FAN0_9PEZI|nr:hypothetical protein AOQ84DRAFT_225375 [Glonium stellatum]